MRCRDKALHWPCNPRVSCSISAPATWKSCLSGWKFIDSHKTHKAFVQMAKRLERILGHNECCSVPCWPSLRFLQLKFFYQFNPNIKNCRTQLTLLYRRNADWLMERRGWVTAGWQIQKILLCYSIQYILSTKFNTEGILMPTTVIRYKLLCNKPTGDTCYSTLDTRGTKSQLSSFENNLIHTFSDF